MNPTVLVAGIDSRALPLEAPLLLRERIPVTQVHDIRDLLDRASDPTVRVVALGPSLGDAAAPDIARRLRAFPDTREVSLLVLLPAAAPAGLEEEAMAAGANAVLRRPLQPGALEGWLAKLLAVARRVRTRLPVQAQVVGTSRQTGASFVGMLRNLSVNGLLLESPLELDVGRDLELEFGLPVLGGPPVRVLGRVVRQAGEVAWPHLGYGVEFLLLPDEALAGLSQFVSDGLQKATPSLMPEPLLGIHATVRREHWVYEIALPMPRHGSWQVEIRRAARDGWRPGGAGPFYVVEGSTPELALREARDFLRRTPER